MNHELPDYQDGFRIGRGTGYHIPNIHLIIENTKVLQKKKKNTNKPIKKNKHTSTSAFWTMSKPLTVWIMTNCGEFFKRWEYKATLPASCLYAGQEVRIRTRHGTTD